MDSGLHERVRIRLHGVDCRKLHGDPSGRSIALFPRFVDCDNTGSIGDIGEDLGEKFCNGQSAHHRSEIDTGRVVCCLSGAHMDDGGNGQTYWTRP